MQVEPGQNFSITYSVNAPALYVSWEDTISGGCSPNSISSSITSDFSTSKQYTISTPLQDSDCTISGYYTFQDGVVRNFETKIVNIIAPVIELVNQTEEIPLSENNSTQEEVEEFSICKITSKFSFLHIFSDCVEGTATFIIFAFVIYKLFK